MVLDVDVGEGGVVTGVGSTTGLERLTGEEADMGWTTTRSRERGNELGREMWRG